MDTVNILVLEDNPDDIVFIERTLSSLNSIEFKIVSNIKDFLSVLDRSIHICILDYTLPDNGGFTGVDVALELKRRNAGTSILFFTGNDNPDILIEMNNCGANKIVGKWQRDKNGNINCWERLEVCLRETIAPARANVRFINYLMSKQ